MAVSGANLTSLGGLIGLPEVVVVYGLRMRYEEAGGGEEMTGLPEVVVE